jgi:hypothetical protein
MAGFEEAWDAVRYFRGVERVSPELKPLLHRVYTNVLGTPVDLFALHDSLKA